MRVLGWISKSHARNENVIQTSGRHGSARKIEKLGFLIPVNPKHAWILWNLAWCHDMAQTCCGNFSVRCAKAHTLTTNKVIVEQVLSRYKSKTQVLLKPRAFYLPITCRHASPFYWLAGAVRGSYSSTGGVRSDPYACSSGGEPFDRYQPRTSLPTSPLMAPEHLFYGVVICLTGLRFKREKWKSEKKVLHISWCKIRRTYIASTATYSKHDEYKDDDSG